MTPRSGQSQRPAGPAAFAIRQRELDGRTALVAVEGELDLSTAPRLKWGLLDALRTPPWGLVLDLTHATFMDSTALGVLVGVRRGLELEQRLAIVCPAGPIQQVFEFAGLDGVFAIFPTLGDALADLRRQGDHSG